MLSELLQNFEDTVKDFGDSIPLNVEMIMSVLTQPPSQNLGKISAGPTPPFTS
jgi:hypothetical protein